MGGSVLIAFGLVIIDVVCCLISYKILSEQASIIQSLLQGNFQRLKYQIVGWNLHRNGAVKNVCDGHI